jgi:hypothetical protein
MNARQTLRRSVISLACASLLAIHAPSFALNLSGLSNQDAHAGLKEALSKGSEAAIGKLGIENGYFGNNAVKIPLPDALKKAEKAMKFLGKQKDFDNLVLGMNRAAEQAVPLAKTLMTDSIKSMTVDDAKQILTGGDDSVTQFFKSKTATKLNEQFMPIVKQTTDKVGLAQQYNSLAGQAKQFGLVKSEDATIEQYVTRKALDGLYHMIGEEEKAIRKNPIGYGSDILRRVFGR